MDFFFFDLLEVTIASVFGFVTIGRTSARQTDTGAV